jgi:hypothetical protein
MCYTWQVAIDFIPRSNRPGDKLAFCGRRNLLASLRIFGRYAAADRVMSVSLYRGNAAITSIRFLTVIPLYLSP